VPVKGAGGLLGRRVLAAVLLALVCAVSAPTVARGETFPVTTTGDEVDAVPGDEYCVDTSGKCSLRAALEEANELSGEDEIRFDEEVFEGDADSVIEPEPALPTISSTLNLVGGSCETDAGVSGPCVEIDDPGETGLKVEGAKKVLIESVAVTASKVGIELIKAKEFFVKGNWLGTSLDGSAAGNEIAISVWPGSEDSRVGGEGEGTGNLIANSSAVGLELHGASKVRVLGNRFGVTPAGDEAALNESNIVIGSTSEAVALENTIGTRISPQAASTLSCDGGCNLISGSKGDGIDLDGGGDLGPPVATTIAGNLIGFNASGAGTIANGGAGIYVGAAPRTAVGGPKPGDANRFAGGSAAVEAGPGAAGLTIRGNLIGTRAGAVPPPEEGILVDSTSLFFPAEEATILGNEIGLGGGTGIAQQGFAATIGGNLVEGAGTGIRVYNEAHGSLVEGNSISDTEGSALLLETNGNEVFGNHLGAAGGAGVRIVGAPPFGVRGNLIGGTTAAAENVIDGSAGAAIEIEDVEESWNEVARNRGAGNGGPFIDLRPSEAGAGDPNDGIQPPAIAAISEPGASGFAEPGAGVRVFLKASPAPGEIESYLGETTADAEGTWSLAFPTSLPAGTSVAATQTLDGGTSELSITAVPLPAGASPEPPGAGAQGDRKAPRTRMLRQPRRVHAGEVARFSFTANEAGSSFQCSLDKARFRPCKSPQKYRLRRLGKHLFRVRAIDPAGNVDATPVRRRFEVVG
jgi:CSLREA domain-containing protein